jgi:hypothetical protein
MNQQIKDHATKKEREREREKKNWPWRHFLKQPNRNYSHLFQNKPTIDGMM